MIVCPVLASEFSDTSHLVCLIMSLIYSFWFVVYYIVFGFIWNCCFLLFTGISHVCCCHSAGSLWEDSSEIHPFYIQFYLQFNFCTLFIFPTFCTILFLYIIVFLPVEYCFVHVCQCFIYSFNRGVLTVHFPRIHVKRLAPNWRKHRTRFVNH